MGVFIFCIFFIVYPLWCSFVTLFLLARAKVDSTLAALTTALAEQVECLGFAIAGRSLPFISESAYPKVAAPGLDEEIVSTWLD
eukprot:4793037-Amphidinium_carterae.1